MRSRNLWLIAGLLFLAITVIAAYKAWPLLHPDVLAIAPLDPTCDLRSGACAGELADGTKIRFSITPRSIPVIQPLSFEVWIEGQVVDTVEVDFQGVDMNMGYNRPKLTRVAAGHFAGKGMLPVCVRDAMEWEAKVLVHTGKGLLAAPFRFITRKPGR